MYAFSKFDHYVLIQHRGTLTKFGTVKIVCDNKYEKNLSMNSLLFESQLR